MSRRWSYLVVCFAAFVMFAPSLQASIIGPGTPIPVSEVLSNFNNSGIDWVYAGPLAPAGLGPGEIEAPSFRASEGWRFATVSEWAARPDWKDFIKSPYTVSDVLGGTSDHSKYKFTTEYWSGRYLHVDLSDAAAGYLTNGNGLGSLNLLAETWYVRDNSTVPEPCTLAIWSLLGVCGMGIGWRRRKQTA